MIPGPLIVQSDQSLLLETYHPDYNDTRQAIAVFAELERAPEHIHTYRLTNLGLWNARAVGYSAAEIIDTLNKYAKFAVPQNVVAHIADTIGRYGRLEIIREPRMDSGLGTAVKPLADFDTRADSTSGRLILRGDSENVLREVVGAKKVAELLGEQLDGRSYVVAEYARGELKQQLLKRGMPAIDSAGFRPGDPFPVALDEHAGTPQQWQLRDYQRAAVTAFRDGGSSGVIVLPCGSGKTVVGAAVMAEFQVKTLILVTNIVAARQWRDELLRRTSLRPEDIGEYSAQVKEIKPVTIASYQILTSRRSGKYAHLSLLDAQDWGMVIYDEVHLLPAPVFKLTAELQARRRLGLTATLVREDGLEGEVFTLIGPKRYEALWKDLEATGAISAAKCFEVRTALTEAERSQYSCAEDREKYRIAACSSGKIKLTKDILAHYPKRQKLVIGQYLAQLDEISCALQAPLVTGKTPIAERERLLHDFRAGIIDTLVVSKVANFSVDLPEASVAVQVSGSYGSRQEEAQRLGRLLRPKSEAIEAKFYALVAADTVDQEFAQHRQRFLAEQGYSYAIQKAADYC
ncbi:DEAD/DEAH box helicase [Canibacter sp. lx-72]|uniref:DNA repair helicase XPB n=1 Tax=Canibacter zhuwentaonis TaxID=2837491 RepID=UPI001BDD2B78|nr:DNA repair helicase XPB [Canibacter zhuwentaonis]MBT1018611.1 DEAD/DEAH box helicase [Canibacter zhuwentaonis]MBT1035808.1 DEAD/DEAH box helicase [Canibacter zhuwentaonis]